MDTYQFSNRNFVRLDAGDRIDHDSRHGIAVLDDLKINHLYSTDGADVVEDRDGTLTLNINGQERALSWATNSAGEVINKDQKLKDQILFLGEHGGVLDLTLNMVEVDIHNEKKIAEGLTKTQAVLQGAAAAANFIPGIGMIVSAGISVVGKIVDVFRGLKDDDHELSYQGSFPLHDAEGGPDPFGEYSLKRLGEKGNTDIDIGFRLLPFEPLPETDKRDVVVVVTGMEMETGEKPGKRSIVADLSFGSSTSSAKLGFDVPLKNGKAMANMILGVDGKEVYYGKWNVGVPFHINVAVVKTGDGLEEIKGLIEETGKQAQRFTSKQPVKTQISNATAAAQSLRSLLTEFLPKKKTIGVRSGLLADPNTFPPGVTVPSTAQRVTPVRPGAPVQIKMETEGGNKVTVALKVYRVALDVETSTLAEALKGQPYRTSLSAVSAVEPLTWTLSSGTLPAGLKLDSLGLIAGTPTSVGPVAFQAKVADSSGETATRDLILTVR